MTNILFTGVGGQGVILASTILLDVARAAGYDVKESEVHGMAQRGGSVECHVRYGEKVYSPLIPKGGADFLVTFELLETMRKLDYMAPEGLVIANKDRVDPAPVLTGEMAYPPDLEDWIKKNIPRHLIVDTEQALKEAGTKKALNIVMLGILSKYLPFEQDLWEKTIRANVKEKFVEHNLKAFSLGRALA